MKTLLAITAFLIGLNCPPAIAVDEGTNENDTGDTDAAQQAYIEQAIALWQSVNRQQGRVELPGSVAVLNVPEDFFYLNPDDAEKVLVNIWGNVPGAGKETLGMLFASDVSPFDDDGWGVTIEYEEDGFVSDKDADDIDYDDLLKDMQEGTREASKQRVSQGYEPIELVGWAAKPFYDKVAHKLHWAQEIRFGDSPTHTLNYNIRVLGRRGVLVMNFIAGMPQQAMIEQKLDGVLALAEFSQGSRYEDFNPDIDKVAAYGIGALVAGKVLAKTGLLAAGLLFLKKFGVLLLAGAGALFGKFRRKAG